jgi:DNA-binding transcriptional regulator PaaX
MSKAQDFREAYPISAKAAVYTPVIFRAGLEFLVDLPWPSLEGIRDFAHFANIGESAIRTALSRAKADGGLLVQRDKAGTNRYHMAASRFEMGKAVIHGEARPEGFIIAVFSFKSEDTNERAAIRDLLKDFGFKKLAQNTYINGCIETSGLKAAAREQGLDKNLYLFTCPDIDDRDLVGKILDLFDFEAKKKELAEYLSLLRDFLPEGLPDAELARRLLYTGPVHYERSEVGEPPFPAKYLPADYPLKEIQSFYARRLEEGRGKILEYYSAVNG